jgi:hypothetical protein
LKSVSTTGAAAEGGECECRSSLLLLILLWCGRLQPARRRGHATCRVVSVLLSACLCIDGVQFCLSVCLSIYISVSMSVCLFVCPSVCLSDCLFAGLLVSGCLSAHGVPLHSAASKTSPQEGGGAPHETLQVKRHALPPPPPPPTPPPPPLPAGERCGSWCSS